MVGQKNYAPSGGVFLTWFSTVYSLIKCEYVFFKKWCWLFCLGFSHNLNSSVRTIELQWKIKVCKIWIGLHRTSHNSSMYLIDCICFPIFLSNLFYWLKIACWCLFPHLFLCFCRSRAWELILNGAF